MSNAGGIYSAILKTVEEKGRITYVRLLSLLKNKYSVELVDATIKHILKEGRLVYYIELRCPKCHAHIGDYENLSEAEAELEREGSLMCAEGHHIESLDEALFSIVITTPKKFFRKTSRGKPAHPEHGRPKNIIPTG